jgi:hypothetical protein
MRGDSLLFPFGQPLHRLTQSDRTPKPVFVLGVYASAVHARWLDKDVYTFYQPLEDNYTTITVSPFTFRTAPRDEFYEFCFK